jgi:dTDP-4-amino-4,6-dideoxygalactose transaminase/lipopolysaccharide/colanic/teichoic acid biosynthesis glycosyltransferase
MQDNFIPFHRPSIGQEEFQAVREVLESRWLTTGPVTQQFERDFAAFVGCEHAVAVSSCTEALHLALDAAGITAGDEVLVPSYTFTATAATAIHLGARPVLCDSLPGAFNMDPVDAARRITPKTRAIIAVHIAGEPCDLQALRQLAEQHGIHLIEDAAHALPASHGGRRIGAISELTAFSFYATKTITMGEGGMLTTSNQEYARRASIMRLHGINGDAWKRYSSEGSWYYEVVDAGFKANMPDLLAALGVAQLKKAEAFHQRRCEIADTYLRRFAGIEELEMPPTGSANTIHSWHLFILRIRPEMLTIGRSDFIQQLKQEGIGTSVHFIPLHLHPYYRDRYGYASGDLPHAENAFARCLSLPIYPDMNDAEVERVLNAVEQLVQRNRRHVPVRNHISVDSDVASRWCLSRGRRWMDIIMAALALLLLSPVFFGIATAIGITSGRPIFFRQWRLGRYGREFQLRKFRTMRATTENGPRLTQDGDSRVTWIGRWLRKWKLDELPQFVNVLIGDMTLVGPRPDLAEFWSRATAEDQRMLALTPGVTGAASLAFRGEERLLTRVPPEQLTSFYIEQVLPQKARLDSAYAARATFRSDCGILLQTLFDSFVQQHPVEGGNR